MTARKKVAILISGRGSNMGALIRAAAEGDYPAEIAGVISDRADAPGLAAAGAAGIPARAVGRDEHADKAAHEAAIEAALQELGAELVCLAGFMRLLSAGFVSRWRGRMINIHPSLLPLFKGLSPNAQALQAGVRVHGCTVHFVTEETDGGPIVAQAAVPVLADDTEERLAERVLKAEHKLYPLALALVASGAARMEDGKTVFPTPGDIGWGERMSLLVPSTVERAANLEDLARRTP